MNPEIEALAEGEARPLKAPDGRGALAARIGGRLVAYVNVCPHVGLPLHNARGELLVKDGVVVCYAHGACFRLEDGACVGGPCAGEALTPLPIEALADYASFGLSGSSGAAGSDGAASAT